MQIFFILNLGKKAELWKIFFKKKGILFRKGPGVKGFENYCGFGLGSIPQIKKF